MILFVGGYLAYLTYSFQFRTFFGDAMIWFLLIGIGLLLFIWTFIIDLKLYETEHRITNFSLTIFCLIIATAILLLDFKIQQNFDKPTLIKVFYDGDYNGVGIDFKEDGTYIFDNSAIGLSDYTYGTYKINGANITLDRNQIDNLVNLRHLKIDEKEINYPDGARKELYLFQVDSNGKIIDPTIAYRVTIDNR